MKKSKPISIMLFLVGFFSVGITGFLLVNNTTEILPNYQPIDIGTKIRSSSYPFVFDNNLEITSMSYNPTQGSYYEVGEQLLWPVLDDVLGINTMELFELRAASDNVEVWVQYDLSYPEGDPRNPDVITNEQANYIMNEFDLNIYPTLTSYFGIPDQHFGDPEGDYYNIDGRNVLLISNIRDELYYDRSYPYYIVGYYSPSIETEFDRNVITIDSLSWDTRTGEGTPQVYEATTAHEYQHLIHDDYNPEDDDFMNEGCSMYSEPLCGYPLAWGDIEAYLATPDNSLIEWADQGDINILADYGCSLMWSIYLSDHYGGAKFLSHFVEAGIPGIEGINAALTHFGYSETFDDLFHDWRIANLIHTDQIGGGKYNYESIDLMNTDPARVYNINRPWFPERFGVDFGTTKSYIKDDTGISMVSTYGSDYICFGGLKDKFNPELFFDGDDHASPPTWIKEDMDGDGDLEWYSTPVLSESDVSITTTIDLTTYSTATLSFETFYNIEELWDYGFIQVSLDGENWISLENEHTTYEHDPNAYPEIIENLPGITGVSSDWFTMNFNLNAFLGNVINLRFRYMTDWAFQEPGWWIDNISINGDIIDNADDLTSFMLPPPPLTEFMVTLIGVDSMGTFSNERFITFNLEDLNQFNIALDNFMTIDGEVLLIVSPLLGPADYKFEIPQS